MMRMARAMVMLTKAMSKHVKLFITIIITIIIVIITTMYHHHHHHTAKNGESDMCGPGSGDVDEGDEQHYHQHHRDEDG